MSPRKTVGEYDIHEGGTLVDENGVTVTYAPSEHASCHKTYGCPMHTFWTDNTLADGRECNKELLPSNDPITTTTTTSTTTTTTTTTTTSTTTTGK